MVQLLFLDRDGFEGFLWSCSTCHVSRCEPCLRSSFHKILGADSCPLFVFLWTFFSFVCKCNFIASNEKSNSFCVHAVCGQSRQGVRNYRESCSSEHHHSYQLQVSLAAVKYLGMGLEETHLSIQMNQSIRFRCSLNQDVVFQCFSHRQRSFNFPTTQNMRGTNPTIPSGVEATYGTGYGSSCSAWDERLGFCRCEVAVENCRGTNLMD